MRYSVVGKYQGDILKFEIAEVDLESAYIKAKRVAGKLFNKSLDEITVTVGAKKIKLDRRMRL